MVIFYEKDSLIIFKDKSNYNIMLLVRYIKKKEYKRSLLRKIRNECNYELREFNELLNINNLKKYFVNMLVVKLKLWKKFYNFNLIILLLYHKMV